MVRKQKTLEEQLAEAQAKQERIKARLGQLEARKRDKDRRTRAYGEISLVRVILERMAALPALLAYGSSRRRPLRRQYGSDRQHAGQRIDSFLAGAAQIFLARTVAGVDLDGEADVVILHHDSGDHAGADHIAATVRVDDAFERLPHLALVHGRHA